LAAASARSSSWRNKQHRGIGALNKLGIGWRRSHRQLKARQLGGAASARRSSARRRIAAARSNSSALSGASASLGSYAARIIGV